MAGLSITSKDGLFRASRLKRLGRAAAALGALAVAACAPQMPSRLAGPAIAPAPQPAAPAGDVLGTGSVKVALLLPLSASGSAASVAGALRNSAALAVSDFPSADIQIVVKDTRGTPEGAQAAAQAALAEGSEIILGPLFSSSVAAVGPVARAANVPVIAFSSDASVAGNGVYLLSFLPEAEVNRIVTYAAGQGRRSVAGLLPAGAYGQVAEGALQQTASRTGTRIVAIERYAGADPAAAQRLAANAAGQADAVLMPDGPDAVATLAPALASAGVNLQSTKLLGSGQWDTPEMRAQPALVGAWYPAPDPKGFNGFSGDYQGRFGTTPPRLATLGYDAVSLAAALSRLGSGQRFSEAVLTNPSGFSGLDGIFRFTRDGRSERGLAVLEIAPGGTTRVIDPAPGSFAQAGF
jgi:ABC-type branched-subunit amino acid transport system substrate-binding protein